MWNLSKPIGTILILLSIFLFSRPAEAKYGGGRGTADDPYQIATAADLLLLGDSPQDYDKQFILTADIDLDPNLPGRKVFDKAVIGSFTGVFDGNGHTISHLTIEGMGYGVGLFGQLASGAEIKNLGVVDVNIIGSGGDVGGLVGSNGGALTGCHTTGVVSGREDVGGIVGENWGTVAQCYSTAAVSGDMFVGGLVGVNFGDVTRSYSTGTVTGDRSVGGLVGVNFGDVTRSYSTSAVSGDWGVGGLVGANCYGSITTSYSTGSVRGAGESSSSVGGLVGENGSWLAWDSAVTQCYSTGAVSGISSVGGLVGCNASSGTVTHCYSTAAVSGNSSVGGLAGSNGGTVSCCYNTGPVTGVGQYVGALVGGPWVTYPEDHLGPPVEVEIYGDASNCFWDIQTSGQTESAGGTGKTTAEMQTASTFLEPGWDFVNMWGIGENQTYPYLRKYSAADIDQDGSVNLLDLAALAENWLTGVGP